eukprot:3989901-Prymnesium_polylepis.1
MAVLRAVGVAGEGMRVVGTVQQRAARGGEQGYEAYGALCHLLTKLRWRRIVSEGVRRRDQAVMGTRLLPGCKVVCRAIDKGARLPTGGKLSREGKVGVIRSAGRSCSLRASYVLCGVSAGDGVLSLEG